jgi:hypothetical protein
MKATENFVGHSDPNPNDRAANIDATVSRMRLANGTLASFEPCLPVQIHALDGWLWITQEGDDRGDTIVSPGNNFLSTRHGKLVVQTLDGATIEVRRLCRG